MIVKQRVLNVVVGIVAIMSIALVIVLTQNVKHKKLANIFVGTEGQRTNDGIGNQS